MVGTLFNKDVKFPIFENAVLFLNPDLLIKTFISIFSVEICMGGTPRILNFKILKLKVFYHIQRVKYEVLSFD
jgi:hypothetical protein